MTMMLATLGICVALLAVWCWWLTGKLVQITKLLSEAAETHVRMAETISGQNRQLAQMGALIGKTERAVALSSRKR